MMAADSGTQNPAEELPRLFAELQQVYLRAADALPANGFTGNSAAGLLKESTHASEIIRRIRKVHNLEVPSGQDAGKL